MPTKPMALPTNKKHLRDEADRSLRHALQIMEELKDEIGHDPRMAIQWWALLSADLEKTLRLLIEMAQ